MPPKRRTSAAADDSTEETPTETTSSHDDTDVEAALARRTQDGKGEASVPPSDFESFATEGVHAEDKSVDEVANEVLRGSWGDYNVVRGRLSDAGHDSSAVLAKVNQRLSNGAPSAYRASTLQVVAGIGLGEWGDLKGLESRLLGAGYKAVDVGDILRTVRNG